MANGFLNSKLEQNGASDYTPRPGNETTTPSYGLEKFFPVQMTKPALNSNPMVRDDELRNYDQPLLEITDVYDPQWSLQQRAYPDTLGWHLSNVFGRDTATGYSVASSGVDTAGTALSGSARLHTWTAPFGPSGALPQTQRLGWAYSDQSTFYTLAGAATESLEIDTPDSGGVLLKASGPGLYLTSASASSSITSTSVAYESPAIRPFVHANLSVAFSGSNAPATTGAASGFTVTINNPVTAVRTLGVTSQFPDRMEKDDGVITLSGTINKRNLTKNDWDAMRDLNLFTITATWTGGYITGTSGPKYGLQIVTQAQLVGGDIDDLDNKRRHGSQFNWKAVYDGTTASSVIKLVNATATYAA